MLVMTMFSMFFSFFRSQFPNFDECLLQTRLKTLEINQTVKLLKPRGIAQSNHPLRSDHSNRFPSAGSPSETFEQSSFSWLNRFTLMYHLAIHLIAAGRWNRIRPGSSTRPVLGNSHFSTLFSHRTVRQSRAFQQGRRVVFLLLLAPPSLDEIAPPPLLTISRRGRGLVCVWGGVVLEKWAPPWWGKLQGGFVAQTNWPGFQIPTDVHEHVVEELQMSLREVRDQSCGAPSSVHLELSTDRISRSGWVGTTGLVLGPRWLRTFSITHSIFIFLYNLQLALLVNWDQL